MVVSLSFGKVRDPSFKFNEAMEKVCGRIANNSERTNLENNVAVSMKTKNSISSDQGRPPLFNRAFVC